MLNNARAQVHTHQFPHQCSIGLGIAFSKRFPITDRKGYRLGSLTMDACEKRRALCHMGSSILLCGVVSGSLHDADFENRYSNNLTCRNQKCVVY